MKGMYSELDTQSEKRVIPRKSTTVKDGNNIISGPIPKRREGERTRERGRERQRERRRVTFTDVYRGPPYSMENKRPH